MAEAHPSTSRSAFLSSLRTVLSLDYRSLAAFRVGISILILCDLGIRSADMTAHYTDAGAVPRFLGMSFLGDPWLYSFHFMSGDFWFQSALFALAAIFALMLLVGYRTRLATFLSWIFIVSLQNRNFVVLNGGDVLFRVLLFWACLLPLGAVFSVDRALSDSKNEIPESHFSAATVGLIGQIIFVYFFSGLIKSEDSSWTGGTALYYAFSAGIYATALGGCVAQFRGFLETLTPFVLCVEISGAFLVLVPWKNYFFRMLAILIFWGFHVSNLFLVEVGFFSPVGIVAWLVFIPSWLWRRLAKPWPDITLYFDRDCGVCIKMVRILQQFLAIPEQRLVAAQTQPVIYREMEKKNSWVVVSDNQRFFEFEGLLKVISGRLPGALASAILRLPPFFQLGTRSYRLFANQRARIADYFPAYHSRRLVYGKSWISQAIAAAILALILAWNLSTLNPPLVEIPPLLRSVGFVLRIDQGWKMFQQPFINDGWFAVPALLKDGNRVDLFKGNGEGGPLDWKKPPVVSATFTSDRWRKYMLALSTEARDDELREYGRFLCRKWNSTHADGELLEQFDVDYMQENTLLQGGKAPVKKVILWNHHCF
jgi:predicted DCC family thiol-disulfide oxidoreductase YuxK